MPRGKNSIFATFGGHLGFLRKMKKCEYLDSFGGKQETIQFNQQSLDLFILKQH